MRELAVGVAADRSEWAEGWRLVVAGATGNALTQFVSALGVVMPSLQLAFDWSRAQISCSVLIVCTCILIVGPATGLLIDRIGARRMALIGVAFYSAALLGVSQSGPSLVSWYIAWAVVGTAFSATGPVVWTLGVGRWFRRQRGLAFALTMAGIGIGYFFIPLLSAAVLPTLGWRSIYGGLALVSLLVGFPIVWSLFDPDKLARRHRTYEVEDHNVLFGYSLSQIVGSGRFWCLILIALLVASAVGGIFVHFQPIMRDAGLTAGQAATYAAVCGPASIVGHLFAGRLLDRFPAHHVSAAFFAVPAAGCVILLNYDGSPLRSLLAAVTLGIATGVEGDVMAYLTAQYFGLRRYGVTYGLVVGCYSFGFGLAPVLAGAAFDALGSYESVLRIMLFGLGISSGLAALLGQPPDFHLRARSASTL
jgi:MFS family permease